MANSFPMTVWTGLLNNGHVQRIEGAVWEYLWLISKVKTEKNGTGYVLNGRPIKIEELSNDLKRDYWTIRRHLEKLKKNGYINIKRAPYGLIISVNKSKKFKNRYDNSAKSDRERVGNSAKRVDNSAQRVDKNAKSELARLSSLYKYNKEYIKYIESIYEYWNSKKIITHKEIDYLTANRIIQLLKNYSLKEIKQAINHYHVALTRDEFVVSFRWTLLEFLDRGFDKFKDKEVVIENYATEKYKARK